MPGKLRKPHQTAYEATTKALEKVEAGAVHKNHLRCSRPSLLLGLGRGKKAILNVFQMTGEIW